MDEDQRPASIDALVAQGDYAGAAQRALADGQVNRAIELLERIWRFADAIPLALRLGDLPLAIRLALDAEDIEGARHIAEGLALDQTDQIKRAAETLAQRGQHEIAAHLQARAGQPQQAAAHFQRAGQWLAAGEQMEKAGRLLEAGQLYERAGQEGATDAEAAHAALRMGRLMGRMGRHREAAAALQRAARTPECRALARHDLGGELLALGLPAAAQEIASRLHGLDPQVPASGLLTLAPESSGSPREDAHRPEVPHRFRILRSLGAGSLGHVYAAHDEWLGRIVALKLLSVGGGTSGPERLAWETMLRESEASARLHHPNIVALHEIRREEGLLVEEYLEGGTLAERLRREGPLPPAVVRRLALDVLAGLQEAHSHGIVHRDIKPANILFDGAGNAKLGDFGAAHLLDFGQTQTGGFIGTLAYLSPEQISGSPLGPAADLYALAATLFEALTGRAPFLGPDLVSQHLGASPPLLGHLRPGLAPAFDETLSRALAKTPAERFASAHAMAQAVAGWPLRPVAALPRSASHPEAAPDAVPPPVLLGHSQRGRVLLVHEPRVERKVLREEMDTPLTSEETEQVRALAALGGPHVQRILALTPERRELTYEVVPGQATRLDALSPPQRELLDPLWSRLSPLGFAPQPEQSIVLTPAGPVVMLAPDYQAAKS
jgi:eukaryotic-like serine/threonine-protein kinase